MSIIDFDKMVSQIDDSVVRISSVFTDKSIKDVEEAKTIIKEQFLNNDDFFIDYKERSFQMCTLLLNAKENNDFDEFTKTFLVVTMLCFPLIKCDQDADSEKIEHVSDIINELYESIKC